MPKETIRKLGEDLSRLLVAGAHLASADDELKKDQQKLESLAKQFGDKAPVLGQLAKAAEKAMGASGADAAREVCSLTTNVAQVRAAQAGLATAEGAATAVPEAPPIGTPCNARYVYDIYDALTKQGSGRDEPITNGVQTGQIVDLRLRAAAIAAIGDSYVGQRVAKDVVPLYGKAVSVILRGQFSAKGGAVDGRRLQAVTAIEKSGAKDLIVAALTEGSAEMREYALDAIGDHLVGVAEFEPLVLETMSKERSAGVRRAGVRALEGFGSDQVLDALIASLQIESCARVASISLGKSPHAKVVDRLLELLDETLGGRGKKKKEDDSREPVRWVLRALAPHKSAKIAAKAVTLLDSHGGPAAECILTSGDGKQLAVAAERLFGKDRELFPPAVRAAMKLGPDEAFKRLTKVLDAPDRTHEAGHARVVVVLQAMGPEADKRWLKVLLKELDDPGPLTTLAIAGIGKIGDKSALKPLIAALKANPMPTTPVKSAIIQALGMLKDPLAINPIFDAIADAKQHDVASAVHYAILQIDNAAALPRARELVAKLEGNAWQFWYYRRMLEQLAQKFGS
jgi:HEAT repeat protein